MNSNAKLPVKDFVMLKPTNARSCAISSVIADAKFKSQGRSQNVVTGNICSVGKTHSGSDAKFKLSDRSQGVAMCKIWPVGEIQMNLIANFNV